MSIRSHTYRNDLPVDPADLAAAVAEQRDELAHLLRDLSDQYDVPARAQELQETAHELLDAAEERAQELRDMAQEGAHELKDFATTSDGRPRPEVVVGVVAVVGVVGIVAVVARKRKRKQKESR